MPSVPFSRRALVGVAGLLAVALVQLPALPSRAAGPGTRGGAPAVVHTLGDAVPGLGDYDARGTALPSALQRRAAAALGARVRWNRFGTPSSVLALDGSLGAASSADPVAAARTWLDQHRSLLGLSAAQVRGLAVVNDQRFAASPARAVLFRQTFGDLAPALDSMVTVGVAHGRIVYVSSSLTKTTGHPAAPVLTPLQGWLKAAANVGRGVPAAGISTPAVRAGWTRFAVPGFAQTQMARVRALALADGTVRPVIEANVVDAAGGSAFAYTVLVDAVTGRILHRQNQVDDSSDVQQFSGEITAAKCGPMHPFETTDANTKQIVATASAVNPSIDIVLNLYGPDGQKLASSDTGTSPEAVTYAADAIPKGIYHVQVCPFDDPTVPFTAPGTYGGVITSSDQAGPQVSTPYPPKWATFLANPALDYSTTGVPRNRVTGCWVTRLDGRPVPGCATPPGPLSNLAAKAPWDYDPKTQTPTFTTVGNAASTHEAWLDPDAPGGAAQAPIAPDRDYAPAFTDAWQNSRCDPSQLVPQGNDVDASVTNLFVAHNRMHDFSYYLGFTEDNYNLQQSNYGQNPDPTRENDPEIGNDQAGALSGGTPSDLGRDNANQIALQDGIPGITNQYLFQPIAGAFYSPCADGALDMTIVGHEYTHAISNRMIGGPDEGITSAQGGAMGESWGDLTATEYLFEHGYRTGAHRWAVGPYATGNNRVGIRDYALDHNPLNYSDYGFDSTGPEVHADGEIWNGTQFAVRQALVRRYAQRFPYHDRALQRRCADGSPTTAPLPSDRCPGNRRWIQLMFDAFLLQQGATSMLDARDAMLAADQMRYRGADQKALWLAFARRGMGIDASTPTADSSQPTPGFASPRTPPARVTFRARAVGAHARPVAGRFYIGRWEARVTPVADTLGRTRRDATVRLSPGRYDLLFAGRGYGLTRSTLIVRAGQRLTKTLRVRRNLASSASGARVVSSSAGSLNAASLIDDTEATNWAGVNTDAGVETKHPYVVVRLHGTHTLRTARVSAMLRPAPASATDVPLAADPDSGSRFTALRQFAIAVCAHACTSADATWRRVYTSPGNAFPAVLPRPVAPDLALRTFHLPATRASYVKLIALQNQCTGYRGYAGEQDNDPTNSTDCTTASDRDLSVRAAELELFG
ncbi:MAG: M36 family metallopeptidase [Nocardioidaceae bacterium]